MINVEKISSKKTIIVVCILVFLIYLKSIFFDFVNFDDGAFIYENFRIKNFNLINLKWYFFNYLNGHYFPVTMLSYGLQAQIWGVSPMAFHVFNLILHLVNCYLVYRVLLKLDLNTFSISFIVAIFGLHPIQIESVVWIGTRGGIMSSFFTLLSISCYLDYLKRQNLKYIVFSFLLFCLAVLSKSAALVVPILFLLIDFKRQRIYKRQVFLEKIPFFFVSFIIGLVAINAAKDLGTVSEGLAQEGGYLDIKIKIFKVLYSWSYYFNHLLLPTGQTSMHFDPEIIDGTLPIKYYLSFIPFSLLLVWTALKGLKTRDFVFWCGFYFVTLALVINILPLGGTIVSERYAYLTVIAGAYFIAKILDYYFKPKIRNIISIFFILIFSGITFFTMDIWKNSLSLHKRSFELFPTSAHATASYAKALARNNQAELALKIQKSDPLFLESPEYLVNIANTYFILDSVEKRDSFLEKAILKDPSNSHFYFKRASFNIADKDYKSAIEDLNIAIDLEPNNFMARKRRASVYFLIEDYGKCCLDWEFLNQNGDKTIEDNLKLYCINKTELINKMDTSKVFVSKDFRLEVLKDTLNGDSILHLFKYDSIGNLSEKGQIENGKYNGRILWYYPSGKLLRKGFYFDSFPFGKWKEYYENGSLKAQYEYASGVIDGNYKYFYKNGSLWTEKHYERGALLNVKQLLSKNGQVLEIGTFKNGNGELNLYDEEGRKTDIAVYENGYLKQFK